MDGKNTNKEIHAENLTNDPATKEGKYSNTQKEVGQRHRFNTLIVRWTVTQTRELYSMWEMAHETTEIKKNS